jgi:CHAT domain-containing protein/tetratricopeptide (TPR) repeat protein
MLSRLEKNFQINPNAMKTLFTLLLGYFPFLVFPQVLDTVALCRQVDSLFASSRIFTRQRDYGQALEIVAAAKDLTLETVGCETEAYGKVCFNLGRILHFKGDFAEAEKWYCESRTIFGNVLGKEHPAYAQSLNNLANLYWKTGHYEKAESLHLEAKAIREKVLGKLNLGYASTLSNLANLYTDLGNYEKAEPLYLEALDIWEEALNTNDPEYAWNFIYLGNLYIEIGQYEKAESFNLEAMSIQEKVIGRNHQDYAWTLNNLANTYIKLGNYTKAESLHLEAKAIRENVLGKDHPDYSASMCGLGNLCFDTGKFDLAEQYFLEAKALLEKAFGTHHPEYLWIQNNLANVYLNTGDYKEAETLHLEVKAIREQVLGKEHADYASSLSNLAELYFETGDYPKAEPLLKELVHLSQTFITRALRHLSERELNNYLAGFFSDQNQILSFTQIAANSASCIPQLCYDNILFYKGFLLNAANRIKLLALSDSTATEQYNLLKSCHRRLAAEYAKPIVERNNVPELEEKANDLEKELARTVAGYGEAMRQVTWQEVQDQLQDDEAAIEFVHFQHLSKIGKPTDSTFYSALLLRPGWPQPKMVYLCEQRQLEPHLQCADPEAAAQRLYALRGISPVGPDLKPGLYRLLWQPLDSLLDGVKTVYYSPSGLLHRVAFSAIPTGVKGEALSDRYQLFQLFSTRSLVIYPEENTSITSAALFGGVDYSSGWDYLPGTKTEVDRLSGLFAKRLITAMTFTDTTATEERFKALGAGGHSPDIIHIATHGFFFPDPAIKREDSFHQEGTSIPLPEHPLMRSGLLLAGANQAWQEGKPFPGREDGIITAYEIAQVNLMGTKLAVLSACDTGLGDIQGSEGVMGLQRSFKSAGVDKIIVSLWPVPDKQTAVFMEVFYDKWLSQGKGIREAFYETQQWMRKRYKDPLVWAGFLLVE